MNLWRTICIYLDVIVYSFVETLLQTIMDLANVEIFTKSVINEFASRIYIILGLVMLFKLMVSFIQVLIDPNKMGDKENGVGNVLKRTVISLALIFLVPSIFDLARQVQNYVVPVIPKVVLGTTIDPTSEENAGNSDETIASVGRVMSFYSFLPFFNYNNTSCDHGQILGTGTQSNGGSETVPEIYSVATAAEHVNDKCPESSNSKGYCYEYRWLISTAVGVYLVFLLVQIAIAIAIRAIKLGICEFVAPIPIASYVDPKTSKQAFSNWVNTSVKTYLDLFIRLIVVYFVIFVFDVVFKAENLKLIYERLGGDFWRGSLVTLFIILGLLQFAKQAPKFLTDMLGLKGGGEIAEMFNPKKSAALGLAGTGMAALGSAVGNFRNSYKNDADMSRGLRIANALRRGAGGFVGSTKRGLMATSKGEGWKGAYNQNIQATRGISNRHSTAKTLARISKREYEEAIAPINAEMERVRNDRTLTEQQRHDELERLQKKKNLIPKAISPTSEKFSNSFSRWQGMETPSGSSYSSAASALSSARSNYFTGEAMKKLNEEGSKLDHITHSYDGIEFNYSQLKSLQKQVENGTYSGTVIDARGNSYSVDASKIGEYFSNAQKLGAIDYINEVKANRISNSTISEGFKQVGGMLDGLNIEPGVKQQLLEDFEKNPGDFFKRASDISKQLETIGQRRSAFEQNQDKK